jgi:hypothetical protein
MSFSLRSKYFVEISSETLNGFNHRVLRPVGSPLILFSKVDGSALASIHFRAQNGSAKSLFAKRPDSQSSVYPCDFQGIINQDNQEFEFVITNLNSDGHINFNILKKDMRVNEVNPGGLNQINELRPMESVAIQCDQADNCTLILSAIKDEKTGQNITIKQAEDEVKSTPDTKPKGTYFYLSVVPEITKTDLCNKFKETVWSCADLICVKEKIQIPSPDIMRGNWCGTGRLCDMRSYSQNERLCLSREVNSVNEISSVESNSRPMEKSMQMRDLPSKMEKKSQSKSLMSSFTNMFKSEPTSQQSFQISSIESRDEEMDCSDLERRPTTREDIFSSSTSNLSKFNSSFDNMSSQQTLSMPSNLNDDNIMSSYATTVGKGRKIVVHSSSTNIEYNYDTSSTPCVIGLSVSDKIQFTSAPSNDELMVLAKEMLKDFLENSSKGLLDSLTKVYPSEQCAICLTDDERPDIVFYQCGHQCCHNECFQGRLHNCPMCRCIITASLKVETQATSN